MNFCTICSRRPFDCSYQRNNLICKKCFDGARSIMVRTLSNPDGTFLNGLKCLKENEEHLTERLSFLSGYAAAYRNQIHCDIQLKSGDDGPPIPAHRSLLAIRSDVFKNMLESDGCKASVPNETITLDEISYIELEALLEFLYTGDLPKDKAEKNVHALTRAAHKYQITFLQKYYEKQLSSSLNSSNVLDVLEISDNCFNHNLKKAALNFIAEHMKEVVFTEKFNAFAHKNPHLSVEITRASATRAIDEENRLYITQRFY